MARLLPKHSAPARVLMKIPKIRDTLLRHASDSRRVGLKVARSRSFRVFLAVSAVVLFVGTILTALAYGRLNQGPVSLKFLIPSLENSINRELADLRVSIEDFFVQRSKSGAGLSFRLRNVRLLDNSDAVVAEAPAAAIGLSGRALFWGEVAPASVDLIGPRLLLFHTPEDGLSLTFSRSADVKHPSEGALGVGETDAEAERTVPPPTGGQSDEPLPQLEPGITLIAPARQINLTRTLTQAFEKARKGETATSYLTRFGVRDAFLVFDQKGQRSFWQVPDFSIDLEHREKRSIILGEANISSASGPWKLSFRTEQSQKQQMLTFTALVKDLIPMGLAGNFPNIPALKSFNLPLDAEASVHLSTDGELRGASATVKLAAGHVLIPWEKDYPILIDEGDLHLRYRADDDRIEVLPSTVQWGESRATLSGVFNPVIEEGEIKRWTFELQANDSVLANRDFGVAPTKVDLLETQGTYYPDLRRIDFNRLVVRIGSGQIELAGAVIDAPKSPVVKMSGRISAMPLSVLKLLWPKLMSPGSREWIGERVPRGELLGGSVEIDLGPGMIASYIDNSGEIPDSALRLEVRGTGLEIHYIEDLPPVRTGDALLRIDGRRLALQIPGGSITLPSGKEIRLSDGAFRVNDLRPTPVDAEIAFRFDGSAEAILELLDQKPLEYVKAVGLKPTDIGGRTDGEFSISMPLVRDLDLEDVRFRGTADVNEARASKAFGNVRIEGGAVTLNVNQDALEARGDILLNGVPALLSWQRIFGAPPEKQPELRLTTLLDENARTQLGLDLNHMVRGPVSAILTVRQEQDGAKKYRVRANLGNADLVMANMGWRKPPGRAAVLTFDIGQGANGNTELQNFRLDGHEIGIEGWIALGDDQTPRAFYFPEFSFNVITRMEIAGEKRADGVWDVQAHGSAYDGRQFFQSLFSAGQLVDDQAPTPADKGGVDLTARIGAIAGFFDTAVSDVSISLQKRNGQLSALDVKGKLNGQAPVAVKLVPGENSERMVLAESEDAGAAFRLVGFYPRVEGGKASLQVNLDAAGPASMTGILWAKDFNVLGDRVVSEVLASTSDDPTAAFTEPKTRRTTAKRQRIPFDQLRVPFSVGGGRFELHDSYVNGPRLGATVRGHVDFKTQQMEIGGTYIPVYGLNSVLGSIPIIGNLLVGRRGEGVVGITFAVKGPTSDPNVMVNPVSMVAPGIFRQIFEYTDRSPQAFPDQSKDRGREPERKRRSEEPTIYSE